MAKSVNAAFKPFFMKKRMRIEEVSVLCGAGVFCRVKIRSFTLGDYKRGAMLRRLRIPVLIVFATLATTGPAQVTLSQASAAGFINTLVPQASQLATQEGRLVITQSFSAVTSHLRDARLDAAIARSLGHIENRTGVSMPKSLASDATSGAPDSFANSSGTSEAVPFPKHSFRKTSIRQVP